MKSIPILILLFFGCNFTYSQYSISGKIIDENKISIPFANILLQQKDSTKIPLGTDSDENGFYVLKNIPEGIYQIEVSVLGFKIEETDKFTISSNKTLNFTLKEDSQKLKEVIVRSRRPVIRQTSEKLIVDLSKTDLPSSTLKDIMSRVPGVLVTNNEISVAGRGEAKILINGKTTKYMDVQTLLRDLPADNISKIEVIEQPGSEHSASGSGAIINIILKKNVRLGTNGNVNFWMGKDEGLEYGTRASIASYRNKLNWQASIGHSKPTWREDLSLERTVNNDIYSQKTKSPFKPVKHSISTSIDYYLNSKNSIGVGGSFRNRSTDRVSKSSTHISNASTNNRLNSESSFDTNKATFNISPYYEYKSETNKLVIDFNYINYQNDNINNVYDVAGSTIPFTNHRYSQAGEFTIKTYKGDYEKTFSDHLKLSFGAKYSQVNIDNHLKTYSENNTNTYDFQPNESNQFFIDETIFALYSKANFNINKWTIATGLRYENSETTGTSTNPKKSNSRTIKKLFPSASISRPISDKLGLNGSYSYRIRRPDYKSLNAFESFLDPYSAEVGNPKLKPSFTNSYQINLTYSKQPFLTIGYSTTKDEIFDLIKQDNNTAQIRQLEVNIEEAKRWDFRLVAPLNLTEKLDGYTGVIFFNRAYESSNYNFNLSKWSFYWFAQASYKLPYKINFEVNGSFLNGKLNDQIVMDWYADLDFSFSRKFMKKQLKASLGFKNMLGRSVSGKIDYGNGNANFESTESLYSFGFKLNYSFGTKFNKKKNKRNSAKEEENRINTD